MKKILKIIILVIFINIYLYTLCFATTKYVVSNRIYTYTGKDVTLKYENELMDFDIPPIIDNNRTLLPIRVLIEKLNGKIEWEEENKKVSIVVDDKKIEMNIDNKVAKVNGEEVELDVAPCIAYKNNDENTGRTVVPVRFVMESLGLDVDWDSDTYTVLVTKKNTQKPTINNNSITKVAYTAVDNVLTVKVIANDEIEYKISNYQDPDRTVIDIMNSNFSCNTSEQLINKGTIDKLRMGSGEDYSRIVVDLLDKNDYTVKLSDDKKELYVIYRYTEKMISDISIDKSSLNKADINIKGVNLATYDIRRLTGPERIQLDLYDIRVSNEELLKVTEISNKYISKVDVKTFNGSSKNNIRIIVYLKGQYEYLFDKTSINGKISVFDSNIENISYTNNNDKEYNLKLNLNRNISENNIEYNVDRINKKYTLIIPYEYGEFGEGTLKIGDNYIKNISIAKNDNTKETTMIIVFYNQRYFNIDVENNILNIKILNRNPSEKFVIVIDPGHGGKGPGAVYEGIKEMDITLAVSDKLIKLLKQNAKIEVYSSQESENKIALKDIANFANELDADLFISIHCNAADDGNGNALVNVSGTETYYPVRNSDENYGITSKKLAEFIQDSIVEELNNNSRGVKERGTLAVLKYTEMPACLCELDFMSCPEALKKLVLDEYQQQYAKAIYDGIIDAINYMK